MTRFLFNLYKQKSSEEQKLKNKSLAWIIKTHILSNNYQCEPVYSPEALEEKAKTGSTEDGVWYTANNLH